ncbi:hypothetical protein [Marinomonas mediterranea]|jgi:hypothetical protein|uniref:Uncharacterized protein n=1 Tax=Marinomonas mediterranea (strain ATCC 700492 / JCM 21426 / NBRC 103028 / MMB-1) TaxID=717774 RepID=F2K250_MARM1|nr:hypothetical protein [Marinomonas mediterranea]ADZ91128.1 hypothetical protein Marme_1873 [Marinomonas mediterranea MMB-1]WCN09101.1 hypothetical protein GV055_09255 [Marinomonas mediterranea]WCN17258.1 hypothetical protein GV053_09440 [Marinomonas mediterranea MMB-1]
MVDNYVKIDSPHDDALKYSQQAIALTVLLSKDSTLEEITPKIRNNALCLLMDRLENLEQAIERIPNV